MKSSMWIIAGLGNPGTRYDGTRHNIGFMVVDRIADEYGITLSVKDGYAVGRGSVDGNHVILLKPLAYMNLSGSAVKRVLRKQGISQDAIPDHLVVVHDDLDLDPGVVKLRRNGSSGGHKGIQSIIDQTGTREFARVKIGIGRDAAMPVEEYVLRRFRPDERDAVRDGIIKGMRAIALIVDQGLDKAMNQINRSPRKGQSSSDEN